jgi:hypothetical protein
MYDLSCTYLMCCLLLVPGEVMMSLMPGALGMHRHASKAERHAARGDVRALVHREAGLKPWDTWRFQSPCLPGGGPGATGHGMTSESSRTEGGSRAVRTRGDTGAIRCPASGPEPQGHVMIPEPIPIRWRTWCHGTRGDT